MKTIGITIHTAPNSNTPWTGPANQTAFFLARTLLSLNRYQVIMVNTAVSQEPPPLFWGTTGFTTARIDQVKDSLDALILVGGEISVELGKQLRNQGCAIVRLPTANRYIEDMEDILFKAGPQQCPDESYLSEVWVPSNLAMTNRPYFELFAHVPTHEVPMLWHPMFLEAYHKGGQFRNEGRYLPRSGPKRISIFDSNRGVFQYVMNGLVLVDFAYKAKPYLINHVYATNTEHLKPKEKFVGLVKRLDIVRDNIATFEARFPLPGFLHDYTDVVVQAQWANTANLTALDVLHLGYPLVHNATHLREAGYYFERYELEQGSRKLIEAIETHHLNVESYEKASRKVLQRHRADAPEVIACFDKLLTALLSRK